MKDKFTLFVVGLALDKNRNLIVQFILGLIAALTVYLLKISPDWLDPYVSPELVGLGIVLVANFAVNVLAAGPLKTHAAKLQRILNDLGQNVGLEKPPLLDDGKTLAVTDEFATALKDRVVQVISPKK